jgi:putative membrane protein
VSDEAAPAPLPVTSTEPAHTHPLTVFVTVLRSVPVLLGIGVAMLAQSGAGQWVEAVPVAWWGLVLGGLAILVVLALAIAGFAYLSWSRLTFYFDSSGDLRVDSGVFTKQQRRLALSRLQSVDVNQPLLARVVGMAEVKVEVAGAGDSRVTLQYLTLAQAQAFRDEVLARAAGLRPDTGTAPQNVIVTVPTRDLVVSLLRSSTTLVGVLATVSIVAVAVLSEGAIGLLALLITGGVPIFAAFGEFVRYFGFTVAESPDGLRLRSGLTSTQAQTVPPGRVHAVEYEQPLLWRSRDWVRVQITVAGASTGDEQQGGGSAGVLLPVAPRAVAEAVVARVLPGLDTSGLDWTAAPPRVRIRAPIQWRHLAVAANEQLFAVRRGRLVRRIELVPHARTQSVHLTQGPWQRRLGVATVSVDVAPGPVSVLGLHQDAATARRIADEQAQRARTAMATAAPLRWMSAQPDPPAPDDVDGPAADR